MSCLFSSYICFFFFLFVYLFIYFSSFLLLIFFFLFFVVIGFSFFFFFFFVFCCVVFYDFERSSENGSVFFFSFAFSCFGNCFLRFCSVSSKIKIQGDRHAFGFRALTGLIATSQKSYHPGTCPESSLFSSWLLSLFSVFFLVRD